MISIGPAPPDGGRMCAGRQQLFVVDTFKVAVNAIVGLISAIRSVYTSVKTFFAVIIHFRLYGSSERQHPN
jgi:hypothetical protein